MNKKSNNSNVKSTVKNIVSESAKDQPKNLLSSILDYFVTSPLKAIIFSFLGIGSISGVAYNINSGNDNSKSEFKLQETALIIEESKKIAKLFTVSYYSEVVLDTNKVLYDTSDNYTNMMSNLFHDDEHQEKSYDVDSSLYELTIIANGTAYAGNDLSKISKQDIITSDSSFTINIKSAEILSTVVNPSDFTIFVDEGKWSAEEVQVVKSIAVKKIENYALENGVLEKANTRTEEMLTEFLKSLGYKNIIINFKK